MRLLKGLAALALLGGTIAAPAGAQEEPRIVLVAPEAVAGAFWAAAREGAEAAAERFSASLEIAAPDPGGAAGTAAAIRAALAEAPAGVIAAIPDADVLAPALADAAQSGVPVVTIGEGFDVARQLGARLAVGQDDFEAGRAAGEAMRRLGARSALCLTAEPPTLQQDMRCKGVDEAFDRPVALVPAGSGEAAEAALKARLEADAAIDAVIAASGGAAGEAAVVAVEALEAGGRVRVAAFDPTPGFMVALAGGQAAFAIDQQPWLQGFLAVALIAAHAETGQMPVDNIRTGPRIVTPEEARARAQ